MDHRVPRAASFTLLTVLLAIASDVARSEPPATIGPPTTSARPSRIDIAEGVLATILHDNEEFARTHGRAHFERLAHGQHPRATVVACSDSRVHIRALEQEPDGDLFVVRNIGNQIDATAGSVEYGVRHLHTPLLLIVGHVGCGAVREALHDYRRATPAIRRELDGLHLSNAHVDARLPLDERWRRGVFENVHQQVENALHEYDTEVRAGALVVVGAVYDFKDELGHGHGRLTLVNVNGDRDGAHIAAHPLVRQAIADAHAHASP